MTETELAAIIEGIVPVIREQIAQSVRDAEIRVAALEGQLKAIGDVRDRVIAVEHKSMSVPAQPPPVDLSPVLERVAAAETRLSVLGDLRDRVVAVEAKAASFSASPPSVAFDAAPLQARIDTLETQLLDATKDVGGLRERVAVVEVRAQIPGPPGPAGVDGKDGQHGKDGVDGVGFDDLELVQDDDRSVTVKAIRGDRVKIIGTARFPVQIQRGVYVEGKSYEQGDLVTWGGSQWHCNEPTTVKPGEGAKAWTLVVKRGRDGRDGRDAEGGLPVVSVR